MKHSKKNTGDYLDLLSKNALELVSSGYYDVTYPVSFNHLSLVGNILGRLSNGLNPVITEIKPSSPSLSFDRHIDIKKTVKSMIEGGCAGISVIVEPRYFKGNLRNIIEVKKNFDTAVLFKDIVVSPKQIEAASKIGADAVLLITKVFLRGYYPGTIEEAIDIAFKLNLEPLVEVHNIEELKFALNLDATLIGINSRSFKTLKTDLNRTAKMLTKVSENEKIIVCESGIKNANDIYKLKKLGGKAFLVGSSVMMSKNIKEFVRGLTGAS